MKDIYRVTSFDEELWERYNKAEKQVWNQAKPKKEEEVKEEEKKKEEEEPFNYDKYTRIVDEFFATLGEVKLDWD